MKALILITLTACAVEAPAQPRVSIVAPGGAPADYLVGANAWSELGFDVAVGRSAQVECGTRWFDEPREVDCQITIGVVRVVGLLDSAGRPVGALSERRERAVKIDASVSGFHLHIASAHEVGHIVLDSAQHTVGGVMGGGDWVLHDVDRELACDAIGAC